MKTNQNIKEYTNESIKDLKKIQMMGRAWLAFKAFEREFKVSIPEASKKNLKNLWSRLGEFSEAEKVLFHLVLENIRFSHATPYREYIQGTGNKLTSLQVRKNKESLEYQNSHTSSHFGMHHYIFCTVEIGNHYKAPSFLGDEVDIITISPKEYSKNAEVNPLEHAWIGTHFAEFVNKAYSAAVLIGDTRYQIIHHPDYTKTYKYTDKKGDVFQKTVHYHEEIFYGDDIYISLGLQLIEHLRCLKNDDYVTYFYKELLNKETNDTQKIDLIASTFQAFMPTTMYPEVKIPGTLSLNNPGIQIEEKKKENKIKKHEKAVKNLEMINDFSDLYITKEEREKPKNIFLKSMEKLNNDTDLTKIESFIVEHKIIEQLSERNRRDCLYDINKNTKLSKNKISELFTLLKKYGLDFHAMNREALYSSPLSQAIEKGNIALVSYYLSTPFENTLNPAIKYHLSLNRRTGKMEDPLSYAAAYGTIDTFNQLCEDGADITRFPEYLLLDSLSQFDFGMMKNIIQQLSLKKISLSQLPENSSVLLNVVRKNNVSKKNKDEAIELLLRNGIKDTVCYLSDTNLKGYTLLHFLAEDNNLPLLKTLVKESLISIQVLLDKKAENGETALSIARNKGHGDFEQYLIELGAKKDDVLSYRPNYENIKQHAAAIVIGYDENNNPFIILGKKFLNNKSKYLFPGGLKDHHESLAETAIREFTEETGIQLKNDIERYHLSAKVFFHYEKYDDETKKLLKHSFIFIQTEKGQLSLKDLRANDDLLIVEAIPLKDIKIEGNYIYSVTDKNPILSSNGFILECIISNLRNGIALSHLDTKSSETLSSLLDMEYWPAKFMKDAVLKNDLPQIDTLLAQGLSIAQTYYINDERLSLLDFALRHCPIETILHVLVAYINAANAQQIGHFTFDKEAIHAIKYNPEAPLIIGALNDILLDSPASFVMALETAIKHKKPECIEIICHLYQDKYSANILNSILFIGKTFLNYSIECGDETVVKCLLDLGALPNLPLDESLPVMATTALMTSIAYKKLPIFKLLIAENADINAIIKIKSGPETMRYSGFPFWQSPKDLKEDLVNNIFNPKVTYSFSINQDGLKVCPFFFAIQYCQTEMAEILFQDPKFDKALAKEILKLHCEKSYQLRNTLETISEAEEFKKLSNILSELDDKCEFFNKPTKSTAPSFRINGEE